jgi:hypothetical protein
MEKAFETVKQAFIKVEEDLSGLEKHTDAAFLSLPPGNLNPNILEERLDDLVNQAVLASREMEELIKEKEVNYFFTR